MDPNALSPTTPDLPSRESGTGYRILALPPDAGPLADEALLPLAAHTPVACLWQSPPGLVVPRTYAVRPGFAAAQNDFAAQGWPIHVRQSGGGVVPQGAGILNLSLAQTFTGRPLDHSEALYRHLCALISQALATFGIEARTQAVEGSFCDGRYNLAVQDPVRKIVGTAQVWRRMAGHTPERHVGLAHALILAQCDPVELTARANALEIALGTTRRYDASRIATLDALLPPTGRPNFPHALRACLHETLKTQAPLPRPVP